MAVNIRRYKDGTSYLRAEAVYKLRSKVINRASKVFKISEMIEAKVWVAKTLEAMQNGEWSKEIENSVNNFSLKDCYEERCKAVGLVDESKETYDARIQYIFGTGSPLRHIPLSKITSVDIDNWFVWLHSNSKALERRSRLTFKNEFKILKSLFSFYKDVKDPAFISPIRKYHSARTQIPGRSKVKREDDSNFFLSIEEINAVLLFLKARPDPVYYNLAKVAVQTGFRIGEIMGICDSSINYQRQTISVNRIMTTFGRNMGKFHDRCKTDSSIRTFHMSDQLAKTLSEIQKENLRRGFRGQDTIFINTNGGFAHPNSIRANFGKAFESILRPDLERSTHVMRHTFGTQTLLINNGNLNEVKMLLGHSNVTQTQKYAKASIFRQEKSQQKLADLITEPG